MLAERYVEVVTSTGATERTRGRPREFDEEAVLDAVMRLFGERGFEAASLADIVEVAGLNKSSLYNAFGSKEELFRLALDRYVDRRIEMLELATSGDGGIDDLLALVEFLRGEALSEDFRTGCLAVNSTAELGYASDAVVEVSDRYRRAMTNAIRRPLERAAELGEIDGSMVSAYADTTLSFALAAALFARGGTSAEALGAHLDSLRDLVESWRR